MALAGHGLIFKPRNRGVRAGRSFRHDHNVSPVRAPVVFMTYALSIEGSCRHCGGELMLSELLANRDGRCPRCSTLLSPEWTEVLLDQASRTERSEQVLVLSLRRLVGLPGNSVLLPHSVMDALLEEVGWDEKNGQGAARPASRGGAACLLGAARVGGPKAGGGHAFFHQTPREPGRHLRRSANETEAAS
jgi:hypothetical protein